MLGKLWEAKNIEVRRSTEVVVKHVVTTDELRLTLRVQIVVWSWGSIGVYWVSDASKLHAVLQSHAQTLNTRTS